MGVDPIALLVADRGRAREARDPLVDVCYLATVAAYPGAAAHAVRGRAEVRALSLRDVTQEGAGILINHTSPKWEQLEASPSATLLIHWPLIGRQYRLWGPVAPMDEAQMLRYWQQKRHASRLMEHYYTEFHPQSATIASHAEFLDGIEVLRRRWPDQDQVPLPESLAGIQIVPQEVEVWHASADRLHYRRRFRRSGTVWDVDVLVP